MSCFDFKLGLNIEGKKKSIVNNKLNYILSHILTSTYQYKDKKYQNGVPMNTEILREIIGKDYNTYVNLLIKEGHIEKTKEYKINSNSRYYKLTDKVVKKGIKKYDNKYYNKSIDLLTGRVEKKMSYQHKFIKEKRLEWLNTGQIKFDDEKKVLQEIKNLRNQKGKTTDECYNAYYNQKSLFDKITDKNITINVDKNGNRLYDNFSNLKKDLRKHIRIEGKTTLEGDVKNSQLQFLSIYLNIRFGDRTKDAMMFFELCHNGRIYEDMVKNIRYRLEDNTFAGRDEMKVLMLNYLYAENHQSNTDNEKNKLYLINQYLKFRFPTIHKRIVELKKRKEGGKELANLLQRQESDVMLKKISFRLAKRNIPHLTIHDSIMMSRSRREEMEEVKREIMEEGILAFEIIEVREVEKRRRNKNSSKNKNGNKNVGRSKRNKLDMYVGYNQNTNIHQKQEIEEIRKEKINLIKNEKKYDKIFKDYDNYLDNIKNILKSYEKRSA